MKDEYTYFSFNGYLYRTKEMSKSSVVSNLMYSNIEKVLDKWDSKYEEGGYNAVPVLISVHSHNPKAE